MEKYNLMGAQCLCVENVQQIKNHISKLIEQKKGGYSVAINAEKIMMYNRNSEMKRTIDEAILPTPDGAGAVIAMKWLHGKKSIKLDLPRTIFEVANEKSFKLFVFGSKEDVNRSAVDILKEKYPGIIITGRRNGYFDDEKEVVDYIKNSEPQIVVTALGSPKQELMFRKMGAVMPQTLFIGCGGALDALTGTVKRAPAFFINNNLEWFYRLIQSPSRIKRQWVLPLFFIKLLYVSIFKR